MSLAENAALVLGLAISVYTIYAAAEAWVLRQRSRRALLEGLRSELARLLQLTAIVAVKADQLSARIRQQGPSTAEPSTWPRYAPEWTTSSSAVTAGTSSTWGPILNRRQLGAFLQLTDALDLYRTRLTLRTAEYDAAPDRDGALARFLSSAGLVDDVDLHDRLAAFERSLTTARHKPHPRPTSG